MTRGATLIRDEAYNRLTTGIISTNWKSARRVPLPTLQEDQLPGLAVYVQGQTLDPEGDDNVAAPRYIATATIGFSVFDRAEKADVLAGSLDPLLDLIEDTLLQDLTFVSLKDSSGEIFIESFPQIRRSYSFPNSGEFYLMEARLYLSVKYRIQFPPNTPNALNEIDVTVGNFQDSVQSGTYTEAITLPQ